MTDTESHAQSLWRSGIFRPTSFTRLIVGVVFLVTIAALPAAGGNAASQIRSEVERLQQSIKDKPIVFPEFPQAADMVNDSLKAALANLSAGRLFLSLQDLGRAEDLLSGLRLTIEKMDAMKGGMPAYEAEWERASLSLAGLDRQARERDWSHSPAAVQALSETAQGMSVPLLEGGRGFAVSTEPKNGLFYIGQAQGEADFAAFCATLNFPRHGAAYPPRSYLPEFAALQEKTNAAFQPPKSVEFHSRFIALNSTLKQGEELDAAQYYAGSLYQYLESVWNFGMLDAVALDSTQQSTVRSALAAARKKIAASKRDDSLAQIFIERAESQVAHADGTAASEDDWKSAKIIAEQVLPAYYSLGKAPARLERSFAKTINLTLVRWPYT